MASLALLRGSRRRYHENEGDEEVLGALNASVATIARTRTLEEKKAAAREVGKQRAEEVQLFVREFCPQIELHLPFLDAQLEELASRWLTKQGKQGKPAG